LTTHEKSRNHRETSSFQLDIFQNLETQFQVGLALEAKRPIQNEESLEYRVSIAVQEHPTGVAPCAECRTYVAYKPRKGYPEAYSEATIFRTIRYKTRAAGREVLLQRLHRKPKDLYS
jgi:hypothetical protein